MPGYLNLQILFTNFFRFLDLEKFSKKNGIGFDTYLVLDLIHIKYKMESEVA